MVKSCIINCPNCNNENPYYNLNCNKCNFYLRDKVSNINLGEIILLLIENPKSAFEKIIFASNKNFIFLILILLSLRFLILSKFISVPYSNNSAEINIIFVIIYFVLTTFLILIIISSLNYIIVRSLKICVRLKDIFSVVIFSFIPSVFALIILYPVELTIFGQYLFSSNPYPFEIKKIFYFLFSIEIILIIWSFILHLIGLYTLRLNTLCALTITVFNYTIIFVALYFNKIIFI